MRVKWFASDEELKKVIETRKPLGLFACFSQKKLGTPGEWSATAVNNSTGEVFTKEFPTSAEAWSWLMGGK